MRRLGLVLVVLMGMPNVAQTASDQVCFASPERVRHHNPGAYASFTRRMPDHKGEKCWFPSAGRHHKRFIQEASLKIKEHSHRSTEDDTPSKADNRSKVVVHTTHTDQYTAPRYVINSFNDRFGAAYSRAAYDNIYTFDVWAKGLF